MPIRPIKPIKTIGIILLVEGVHALLDELEGSLDVVVETHAEAYQAFAHAHLLLDVLGHLGAGALAAVAEEGLEVTQRDGEVADTLLLHELHDLAGAVGSAHVDADHAAEAVALVHHAAEQLVVGMLGQTGVVVFEAHLFEALGQVHGVLAVLLHADVQGVQVLVDGGAAHRVEHRAKEHAGAVVDVDQAVDVLSRTADGTGHAVVRAVDVLGHRVDGDVGTQAAGAENHRGEGVVNDELGADGMGHLAQLGHIGDAEQGVVHGLGVHDLGVGMLVEGFLHGIEVLHVDESHVDTELLNPVVHEGEGATVGGHAGHDVVAALHLVQQGAGDGGQTAAGDPSHLGAFHSGKALAESEVGGVPVTAVEEVALGLAVESLGHQVCLGESESGGVTDCGVHAAVGVAAIDALNSGCGIKFVHRCL